jgi:hypothetical protein
MVEKMEHTALVKNNGGQPISDPLAECIVGLINAMRSDFGPKFKSQFEREIDTLKQYKRRLYQKLRGKPINAIVDGYEEFVCSNPEWPPTVPELAFYTDKVAKELEQKKINQAEAERVAALPPPTIDCNPLELLAKAKSASKTGSKEDKAAWLARKAEALKNNEAVLVLHGQNIKRRHAQPVHFCVVNGCQNAGSLSAGTKGGDNWYCAKHFKMAS